MQEEAPALGKPVLVLREESERPEAIAAGVARLVGPRPARDRRARPAACSDDPAAYRAMARGVSPYGDGHAAGRIVAAVAQYLGIAAALKAAG